MRMITKENELQHFGIPGMKWGHRRSSERTVRILNRTADTFANSAQKSKSRAREANAYVWNRTDTTNKRSPTGGPIRSLSVKLAKNREKQYLDSAKKNSNMAKGITKAQKLVKGMTLKQAVSTLETSAGYSRGVKVTNALLLSRSARLSMAAVDYAMQQTKMGEKAI